MVKFSSLGKRKIKPYQRKKPQIRTRVRKKFKSSKKRILLAGTMAILPLVLHAIASILIGPFLHPFEQQIGQYFNQSENNAILPQSTQEEKTTNSTAKITPKEPSPNNEIPFIKIPYVVKPVNLIIDLQYVKKYIFSFKKSFLLQN